jgi:hypothetical protein
MEDMSTHSGNKLTEEQIEQLIKRLRGVEHIELIVTIEDSNVNNEKMATFAEVVNNQSSNKNNTDESDSMGLACIFCEEGVYKYTNPQLDNFRVILVYYIKVYT